MDHDEAMTERIERLELIVSKLLDEVVAIKERYHQQDEHEQRVQQEQTLIAKRLADSQLYGLQSLSNSQPALTTSSAAAQANPPKSSGLLGGLFKSPFKVL